MIFSADLVSKNSILGRDVKNFSDLALSRDEEVFSDYLCSSFYRQLSIIILVVENAYFISCLDCV